MVQHPWPNVPIQLLYTPQDTKKSRTFGKASPDSIRGMYERTMEKKGPKLEFNHDFPTI